MSKVKTVIAGIALVIVSVFTLALFEVTTIEGHEVGVKETWGEGVVDEVLHPKTYFLFPGFTQKIFTYDASSKIFVMNNSLDDSGEGRDSDAYHVQSLEGQDLTISLNVRWRMDPAKVVEIHKTVRDGIEEKILRPVVMRVVKDEATKLKAIDAYSGEGLVKLQSTIQSNLTVNSELAERGVIIENFVIERIDLDPKYIEEIKLKQIATQRQLRAVEEQKAAEAEALVAKAKAQSDLNKAVVEATRDFEVGLLKAQQSATNQVLQAQAEAKKLELEAMGARLAAEEKAKGIEALGRAEAIAQELKMKAYNVPGTETFARIEVSKNLGTAFQGIKGFLPADLRINVLAGDFEKALDLATGNVTVPTSSVAKLPVTSSNGQ